MEEEFLKNHLKNSYMTVEVCSEIRVNGEHVEDKDLKRKEAFVINTFCSDESSPDFLIIDH